MLNPNVLTDPSLPEGGSAVQSWGQAPTGSFSDVAATSFEDNLLNSSLVSRNVALQQAVTQRNKDVKAATGQDLEDPTMDGYLSEAVSRFSAETGEHVPQPDMAGMTASDLGLTPTDAARVKALQMQVYQEKVDALAAQYPAVGGPIEGQAAALANRAATRAQDAYQAYLGSGDQARSPLLPMAASLAGGMASGARDPLMVASLFAGGGEATMFKSVAGQMLETFLRHGAINAAVQGLEEPGVQSWAAERGQPSGLLSALQDMGVAFAFGGTAGMAAKGLGEIASRLRADPRAAEGLAAEVHPAAPEAAAALRSAAADVEAAAGAPPGEVPAVVPEPERLLREAARHMERDDSPAPSFFSPAIEGEEAGPREFAPLEGEAHAPDPVAALPEAASRILGAETPPEGRTLDIPREVEAAKPPNPPAEAAASQAEPRERPAPRPMTLLAFLKSVGGVKNETGELKDFVRSYPGLVNNRTGMSYDMARRTAAEAGYLGADINRAMAETDNANLLDAIWNHRVKPVYSVFDDDKLARWQDQQERQNWRDLLDRKREEIDENAAAGGLTADDELREHAAQLMAEDGGLEPDEAVERAAIQLYNRDAEARWQNGRSAQGDAREGAGGSGERTGPVEPGTVASARGEAGGPAQGAREAGGEPAAREGGAQDDLLSKIPVERDGKLELVDRADIAAHEERTGWLADLIENCIL